MLVSDGNLSVISFGHREGNFGSCDSNNRGGRKSHSVHVLGRKEGPRFQFPRTLLGRFSFCAYSRWLHSGIYEYHLCIVNFSALVSYAWVWVSLPLGFDLKSILGCSSCSCSFPWVGPSLWSMVWCHPSYSVGTSYTTRTTSLSVTPTTNIYGLLYRCIWISSTSSCHCWLFSDLRIS